MADRRMISRKIIESAKFLKMPTTAQNLYCHLIVNADDDGIVESYPVMCIVRAEEEDLRILESKNFIKILNEDHVTYICDWAEQNHIRPDRKTDSIYQNLLKEKMPQAPILEKKQRSDLKKHHKTEEDDGPSMDGPRTAEVSTDKESSDKSSAAKYILGRETLTQDQYDKLAAEFGRTSVDSVIGRIQEHPYYGCLNIPIISQWCREDQSKARKPSYRNAFNNFEQHQYTDAEFAELEIILNQ